MRIIIKIQIIVFWMGKVSRKSSAVETSFKESRGIKTKISTYVHDGTQRDTALTTAGTLKAMFHRLKYLLKWIQSIRNF